jgi:kinesin family protein 2/24
MFELTLCFKLKFVPWIHMDLIAYVEKHEFVFDAVLDQYVSNDEVNYTFLSNLIYIIP